MGKRREKERLVLLPVPRPTSFDRALAELTACMDRGRFSTSYEARRAMRVTGRVAYHCRWCSGWHLGAAS